MQRIVDGILYEGKHAPDQWDVSVWEARGHREVSARAAVVWEEIGPVPPLDEWDLVKDAEALAERREAALLRNARRAKTQCRRIIKAQGFDELLTITYRENMGDRATCKKHFKEWVRRMKAALGGRFEYCASFERQDRGAMHVHVACHKLPEHVEHRAVRVEGWRLGTVVWRSIVGGDNGLVFVGGKKGRRARQSAAKMAEYVSKYITKDYADVPAGANRYSRSDCIEVSRAVRVRLEKATLAEVIACAFDVRDGDVMVSHRVGHFRDSWWLCTERPPPIRVRIHRVK